MITAIVNISALLDTEKLSLASQCVSTWSCFSSRHGQHALAVKNEKLKKLKTKSVDQKFRYHDDGILAWARLSVLVVLVGL